MVQSHFFFFNDTATTEIYTLSLHDALPIYHHQPVGLIGVTGGIGICNRCANVMPDDRSTIDTELSKDRKSTRLNSSHSQISYAAFCLKKKKELRERDATSH